MKEQRGRITLSPITWVALLVFVAAAIQLQQFNKELPDEVISLDSPENPDEREQWWRSVVGPPPTPSQRAQTLNVIEKQIKAMNRGAYRDAGINGWENRGPDNIGGRVRAVAINPDNTDELFIGAVAGGIWRTQNGGTSWTEVTSPQQAFPVTYISYNPLDPSIMYATTGEFIGSSTQPGTGILKSTNGGSSWTVLPGTAGPGFYWLAKIICNPIDPDVVYAVGSTADINGSGGSGVLYRSNDAGATWNVMYLESVPPTSRMIFDIEINRLDTSEISLGTWLQGLITFNAGISWNSFMGDPPLIDTIPNFVGRRCEIAYCDASPTTIYMSRFLRDTSASDRRMSQLWRSTNSGLAWSLLDSTSVDDPNVNVLNTQGDYDNALWVDNSDCDRAIVGGINLFKWADPQYTRISAWEDDIGGNENGGNNSAHADQHIIVPDPNYNGTTNNRVFIGNDGGIYKSDNIWTTTQNSGWSALNSDLHITQLYGVDVSLSGDVLVGGSQDNSYFFTYNGNSSNINWDIYGTGDGGHCAVNKDDDQILYVSTQNGKIYRSDNGGNSFSFEFFVEDNDTLVEFIAPVEQDPATSGVLYTGGNRLWRLSLGPNPIFNPLTLFPDDSTITITSIEIAVGNSDIMWFGMRNGVMMQTSNGTAFSPIFDTVNTSGLPSSRVNDIAIHPLDHSKVAVVFGGGSSTNNIFLTEDGGSTWTNISLSTPAATLSVIWHPLYDDWLYVGTTYGIFASEDGGSNWSITPFYDNGEGPVYTTVTELVWQGDGSDQYPYYLVAATHGRGVWRSQYPIYNKYYVDKNCSPCGQGSFSAPFATFTEAVEVAGDGTEIIFLSGGNYDEITSSLPADRRIRITLDPGAGTPAVIK